MMWRRLIAGLLICASLAAHARIAPPCEMGLDSNRVLPCWLLGQLAPCAGAGDQPCCATAAPDAIVDATMATPSAWLTETAPAALATDDILILLAPIPVLKNAANLPPALRFARYGFDAPSYNPGCPRYLQTARLRI